MPEKWFQSVFPGPEATASPGHMLEIQTLQPYPRTADSETLGMGRSCPAI